MNARQLSKRLKSANLLFDGDPLLEPNPLPTRYGKVMLRYYLGRDDLINSMDYVAHFQAVRKQYIKLMQACIDQLERSTNPELEKLEGLLQYLVDGMTPYDWGTLEDVWGE